MPWFLVAGLLVLAAPASAGDCAPRFTLESSDPAVIAEVSAALSAVHAGEAADEATCVRLRVHIERAGDAWVVSTARPGQPPQRQRVEALATALALVEAASASIEPEPGTLADEGGRSLTASLELTFRPRHPRAWGPLLEVRQPVDWGLGPLALLLRVRAALGDGLEAVSPSLGPLGSRQRALGASLGLAARWVVLGALTADVGAAAGARATSVTVDLPPCGDPAGCQLALYWPSDDGRWRWAATAELTLGLALALTPWLEVRAGASAELASGHMRAPAIDEPPPLAARLATGLRVALP